MMQSLGRPGSSFSPQRHRAGCCTLALAGRRTGMWTAANIPGRPGAIPRARDEGRKGCKGSGEKGWGKERVRNRSYTILILL